MKIFDFILSLFKREDEFFPGVLDERYSGNNVHEFAEGIAVSANASFPVKKIADLRKFPWQYQYKSSACVAYTMAKIACVLYFLKTGRKVKFSPAFYYPRRLNKPDLGMYFSDISILASEGCCLYDLLPCEGMNEEEINAVKIEDYHKQSADAFALPVNWIELTDFDTVAATIEKTGKPVMLWFSFGPGEFFGTHYPKILGNNKPWAHSVCAVDAFTDSKDGKQYIKIEDSADKEAYYDKYIDRDFFDKRCWLRRYPINFKFIRGGVLPIYSGTVASMQDILRALGYFPINQSSTNFWGSITTNAVREFCKAYAVVFKNQTTMWPELEAKLKSL